MSRGASRRSASTAPHRSGRSSAGGGCGRPAVPRRRSAQLSVWLAGGARTVACPGLLSFRLRAILQAPTRRYGSVRDNDAWISPLLFVTLQPSRTTTRAGGSPSATTARASATRDRCWRSAGAAGRRTCTAPSTPPAWASSRSRGDRPGYARGSPGAPPGASSSRRTTSSDARPRPSRRTRLGPRPRHRRDVLRPADRQVLDSGRDHGGRAALPDPGIHQRTGARDRWFRQRLTAKVRQRSICPRCRSRIAWRLNAHGANR